MACLKRSYKHVGKEQLTYTMTKLQSYYNIPCQLSGKSADLVIITVVERDNAFLCKVRPPRSRWGVDVHVDKPSRENTYRGGGPIFGQEVPSYLSTSQNICVPCRSGLKMLAICCRFQSSLLKLSRVARVCKHRYKII
jgi:hypothetical protein